jgi:hypothetical protein
MNIPYLTNADDVSKFASASPRARGITLCINAQSDIGFAAGGQSYSLSGKLSRGRTVEQISEFHSAANVKCILMLGDTSDGLKEWANLRGIPMAQVRREVTNHASPGFTKAAHNALAAAVIAREIEPFNEEWAALALLEIASATTHPQTRNHGA